MRKIVLAAALALMASTTAASAYDGGWGGGIDQRQRWQEYRIQQGVRSGALTRREYWKLEREQAYIRRMERAAKADGHISPYERARLRNAQNAAGRDIYREKHDGNRRWFRPFW
jgi:uncharacterized membrane protein YebE (DUF533 family)